MCSFWKAWNQKFPKSKPVSKSVAGCISDNDIANAFADAFSQTFIPNDSFTQNKHDILFNNLYGKYKSEFDTDPCIIDDIVNAVKKLKLVKSAGCDNIVAEHIHYAHPIVLSCLCRLFNLIMHSGVVPDDFGVGIVIPLLKSNDLVSR